MSLYTVHRAKVITSDQIMGEGAPEGAPGGGGGEGRPFNFLVGKSVFGGVVWWENPQGKG